MIKHGVIIRALLYFAKKWKDLVKRRLAPAIWLKYLLGLLSLLPVPISL